MGISFSFPWEVSFMVWLQSACGTVGNYLAQFFSLFSEKLFLVGVLGFIYWCWDKKEARNMGVYLLVNVIACPILKNCFPRRRPYMDHENIRCLKAVDASGDIYDPIAQGFSFPSIHSSNSAALYTALGLYAKKKPLRIAFFALPFFVAFSRVILGVHYPTDVLCGLVIGYLILFVMRQIQKGIKREWLFYLIILLCAFPAFFFCKSNDFFSAYGLALGIFGGFLFEKSFVNFSNTRFVWKMIVRTAGGLLLFAAVNALCKLIFPGSISVLRMLRYALSAFCVIGPYPMLFSKN